MDDQQQFTQIKQLKRDLRDTVRARRKTVPAEERKRRDFAIRANLIEHLHATPGLERGDWVAAYVPMPGEPGGEGLASAILEAGYRLMLPRVDGKILEWTALDARNAAELEESLARSEWGILEPTIEAGEKFSRTFIERAEVGVVPALGIDRSGVRLGQGGGFYDRTLELGYPRAGLYGVIDQQEFVDDLPTVWHDCVVDAIVTENSVFFPNGRPGRPA